MTGYASPVRKEIRERVIPWDAPVGVALLGLNAAARTPRVALRFTLGFAVAPFQGFNSFPILQGFWRAKSLILGAS